MCATHWAMVPPALRAGVEATEVVAPSSQGLLLIRGAIDAVAHRESRRLKPVVCKAVQLALFDVGQPAG